MCSSAKSGKVGEGLHFQEEGRMGWEMEVGVQEGRDICIPVADSY